MTASTSRRFRLVAAVAALLGAGPSIAAAQYPGEPPAPGPITPLRFPAFQQARLQNGLEIVLVENHDLPIVSVSLTIPTGSVSDPPGQRGLAEFVAELITKGTESRSAEEIAAAIEGVGGSLNAGAGEDFFTLSSTVLTDYVELAFGLMADVLLRATYPEEELTLARTRALSALRLELSDPGAIADRYFVRTIYGEHPYGLRTTEASLNAITRDAVTRFAGTQLKPGGALLVIAGDLRLDRVRALARQHLGSWTGSVPARSYGAPPPPRPTEILLVHRPGSEQSNIVYGNLGLKPREQAFYAGRVFNKVLGGGADSRLFLILREQKSWTYGSYSNLSRPYDVGTFRATAEVRTNVTDSALVEMLHQLRRIRIETVPDSELTNAKGYLTGVFPLTIQTPQGIAGQVSTQKRLGLGDDYLQTYRERIAAITAQQARAAANRLIRPDSAVIVVVGDGARVYEPLRAIAPVRIIDVDGRPLTAADLNPPATALAFDPAGVVARRDSFQVSVQGQVFGGIVVRVEVANELTYRVQMAIPVAGVNLETTVRMSPSTFVARSVDQTGQYQGAPVETHMAVADGRITGTAQAPQQGGPVKETAVDTVLAAGTLVSEQIQAVLPAMPLAAGATLTVNVFDGDGATTKPYTFRVGDAEEVTVPAGTFEVLPVAMTGGDQGVTFYVTTAAPHRVVKSELTGQPIVFELVSTQ